jgi:hypothetical protein
MVCGSERACHGPVMNMGMGNKLDAWDVLLEVTVKATARVGDILQPCFGEPRFPTFNDGGEGVSK